MEQLAMLLATSLMSLDPDAATRILWDAAKLYRASTSEEERTQLLRFQAQVCALVGRPAVVDAESRAEEQSGPIGSDQGVSRLVS